MVNFLAGAGVALFHERRCLIVQRAFAPFAGHWSLPGGHVEAGETPLAAARREFAEETGLLVGRLQFVTRLHFRRQVRPFALSVFTTQTVGGHLRLSSEVLDARWVQRADLQRLTTTPNLARVVGQASAVLDAKW